MHFLQTQLQLNCKSAASFQRATEMDRQPPKTASSELAAHAKTGSRNSRDKVGVQRCHKVQRQPSLHIARVASVLLAIGYVQLKLTSHVGNANFSFFPLAYPASGCLKQLPEEACTPLTLDT